MQGIWFRSYLNDLVVFPTFFNWSLNLALGTSWSVPQSALCLVFADCIEILHLDCKDIISLILLLPIRWCPCAKSSLVLWEEGICYGRGFSWQNSISLCPASFYISRQNLPVTPGVSWLPTFAFQSPIMKRTSFWVLVLEGLVGLHRTVQLQPLQPYWPGNRLGLLWYWMVYFGNEQRSSVIFEIASKYCISDSFVDYDGYSISSKGIFPTVVDIMVIWVKLTHSSPF